jgi:DNA helicase-2/ATP-dependent DNA helicase PcrA
MSYKRTIADLHIHSRYSRATSAKLNPAYLERWANIKGINLLGTGDCTHPQWLAELRENLEDAEPGFYTLKDAVRAAFDAGPARIEDLPRPHAPEANGGMSANAHDAENAAPRFVLSAEISTIYKRDGKTRKVHHLLILPDFKTAAAFQVKLERIGNIRSDGRPILGLDSRELLALLLETDERDMLIPAHIWTPWFSALGAKSGFDSIEECYGDLTRHIPAIETGLSSDPPMNWALSSLDRYAIISNSDAHSPDKLGREATIFDMEFSYNGLFAAMRDGVRATVEFFPEEGKYHCDGHRKCGVCLGPEDASVNETLPSGEKICPVCGKPLTRGVMGRVLELADRPLGLARQVQNEGIKERITPEQETPKSGGKSGPGLVRQIRRPFHSLIPLKELLGELLETGPASQKVGIAYNGLIEKAGSELALLMDMNAAQIEALKVQGLSGELLAQAVGRMRRGEVSISPGYDGEYGVIRVFAPGEKPADFGGERLFEDSNAPEFPKPDAQTAHHKKSHNKTEKTQARKTAEKPTDSMHNRAAENAALAFNPAQEAILNYEGSRTLVIAWPGTGKTAVLAGRIAKLLDGGAKPDSILALSFTVKAAAELRERIGRLSLKTQGGDSPHLNSGVAAATFHSFCASALREHAAEAGLPENFRIADEARRETLLENLSKQEKGKNAVRAKRLGSYIEERKRFLLLPGEFQPKAAAVIIDSLREIMPVPPPLPQLEELYRRYRDALRGAGLLDYEDLIAGTVRLFCVRRNILDAYRNRFRFIFVDEYQVVNIIQYALLRLLADGAGGGNAGKPAPALWVIGDPNQAIYGFRGSDKRFIDRFMDDYPGARRFELAKSFRCAAPIMNAARRLAGSELAGTEKAAALYRREYPSDKSEAEGVARIISRLIGGASFFAKDSDDADALVSDYEDSAAPGDCAVLIRAAPLAAPIAKALDDHGIPFELTAEQCWWDTEPYKNFLNQVRESAAPEDEFKKGENDPALKRLFDLAALFGDTLSLLDALAYSGPGGLPGTSNEVSRGKSEGVNIMTIHAAKGLEFDHVFVIGLEDGILPFTLYDESDGDETKDRLDEERRLLYVAMTRARLGLYLSWARSRNFKGRKLTGTPSPFLNELEKIVPLLEGGKMPPKDRQLRLF